MLGDGTGSTLATRGRASGKKNAAVVARMAAAPNSADSNAKSPSRSNNEPA